MSYVGINSLGYGSMTYFDVRSQFASYSTIGSIGAAFASRTSDNDRGESNCIGAGSYVDNDRTSGPLTAWSWYGHAVRRSGAGTTFGTEIDVANQSSDTVALDPYQMGNLGTTVAHWVGAGGESAQLEPVTHYPLNAAFGIVTTGDSIATAWASGQVIASAGITRQNDSKLYTSTGAGTTGATPPTHTTFGGVVSDGGVSWEFSRYISSSRFKKGIVFQQISLVGTDGDGTGSGIAMEMARGHELRWKYNGGELSNSLIIRSDGGSAAGQTRLVAETSGFGIKGVQSDFTTENYLFRVSVPTITGTNATNYLFLTPTQAAGGLVTLAAVGTDTNIDFNLTSKGTGKVQANGNDVYHVGGDDVAVADGGTGAGTARGAAANLNLPYTLAHSAIAVSHTGDTNETPLAIITMPAGAPGPNGYVEVEAYFTMTGTNSKTPRIRFGGTSGTAYSNAAQTTNVTFQTKVIIANAGVANSQKGYTNAVVATYGASGGAGTTSAVDTTAAVDIVLSGILTNAGESITLERYTVRVFYGA